MVATCTNIHTAAPRQDIDQAAKYIGAGAATVGVAGSGMLTECRTRPFWQHVGLDVLDVVVYIKLYAVCEY